VATPDDLDALLDALHEQPAPVVHDGEHLYMSERLVISPAAGIFSPADGYAPGRAIEVGDLLGHVGEHEVRSRFAGTLEGLVAHDGERLTASQPVAWLRTA